MRNQLLFLMYFLATTESFAGGSTGIGPPMRSIGELKNGTSTIGPAGHSANCSLNKAQLVIEARGTNEEITLNTWVVANQTGGSGGSGPPGKFVEAFGGSSGSGPLGKKTKVVAVIGHHSFSKLKFFIENNENLVIKSENSWLEVQSVNYFADPDQVEIVLESTSIKLMASEGGIAGSGPPAKQIPANNSFEGGAGGSTPTIADIDNGAAGGGGTIGDVAGTIIGTGSGGTLSECGISGGSGVISGEIGGSGIGGGGWTKEADGIAVGGGSPE